MLVHHKVLDKGMTIKWEYDIEGTVEEIKELLGMMQPKAVVQEEPPKAVVKAKPKAKPKRTPTAI